MADEAPFAAAAEAFLRAVRAGDVASARRSLGILEPWLRPIIERKARRGYLPPDLEPRDIAQEVLASLHRLPPSRALDGSPIARLRAWVGAATGNLIRDLLDKRRVRLGVEFAEGATIEDAFPPPVSVTEARSVLNYAWLIVRAEYPTGLAVLEALRHDPEAPDSTIAAVIGSTPGNVRQIRYRIRLVLARHHLALRPE